MNGIITLNESDFDTYCTWTDTKHVTYNSKTYEVIGCKSGYLTLREII